MSVVSDLERESLLQELTNLFGSYKAEWLNQRIFDVFTRPSYFPDLKNNHTYVLVGGRGTGKTTVLRGLSYEGQESLTEESPSGWGSYGLYYKVDSNHLSAFTGRGLDDEAWTRPFGHYLNLLFADNILRFLLWYEKAEPDTGPLNTQGQEWRLFERTMALTFPEERAYSVAELVQAVAEGFIDFQLYLNNIDDESQRRPLLSVLGSGVEALVNAVQTLPKFEGKTFSFLIDEYETLEDYQQRVFNTLIKQSPGRPYSFKIGVRELGWRQRYTLHDQELREPSDYRLIDIEGEFKGKDFNAFALDVVASRFAKLTRQEGPHWGVRDLFPSLTLYQEAQALGVDRLAAEYLKDLPALAEAHQRVVVQLPTPLVWFAAEWYKEGKEGTTVDALRDLATSPKKWDHRFRVNHGYASLFAIRPGRIRKLYAGWDVYLTMASGNIRFFLQLIEVALREHITAGHGLNEPLSSETQTAAARSVGQTNFKELEMLDTRGARMMWLLLGVGRLFQIMAWSPFRHAPEVNQFVIRDEEVGDGGDGREAVVWGSPISDETEELLKTSINHLALQRSPETKLSGDIPRGFEYWIHPVFSAFFQISHRRKRHVPLSTEEVYYLAMDQKRVLSSIVRRHGRDEELVKEMPFPPQLDLFYGPEDSDP